MLTVHDVTIHNYIKQRRKTLCLSIAPNGEVTLKVPIDINDNQVQDFILRKKKWLQKKLLQFAAINNTPKNPLGTGTTILYLGAPHKLIIVNSTKQKEVRIENTNLILFTTREHDERYHLRILEKFFLDQAQRIFHERLSLALNHFPQMARPVLKVRKYKSRWGSYASNHVMSLNSLLIHTSIQTIDYIIIHELCHYYHKGHNTNFYALLSQIIPDWKKIKKNLDSMYLGF